ncbi:1-acyl-sn-glycerol-3-phosphate acyltransferase [Patescibacteria group bacterium]|nr:1-acyl-sn-glycerol-3-phosphate acyltransferase [Patescibacteria group bacterium]MBU2219476.1 1-acyl-sn-glycerol-3-phosphate acyltransferase [Patescibacteria group bacterium]
MRRIKLFIAVWTIGLLGGIIFCILKFFKRIEVVGYERKKLIFPKKGLIVIYNHPSLYEPVLMPFLFFPWYLFNLRLVPFSVPDKRNFFDKWWFAPFRIFCIYIERENAKEILRSMRLMINKLNEGGIIIISPEGGRTFKGDTDGFRRKGNREIRKFKSGIEYLLKKSHANILPVWIEGGEKVIPNKVSFTSTSFLFPRIWEKVKITLGEPVKSSEINNVSDLEEKLLSV